MKKELFDFFYLGKKKGLDVFRVPWWYEGIGLMFSRRGKAKILLFDLKKNSRMGIHSWFVFFPFVAIWLDAEKNVIDVKRVNSFEFGVFPSGKFRYLIEVPLSGNYDEVLKILDEGETFK